MKDRNRVPHCTCNNEGQCGFCPSVAVHAIRETRLSRESQRALWPLADALLERPGRHRAA